MKLGLRLGLTLGVYGLFNGVMNLIMNVVNSNLKSNPNPNENRMLAGIMVRSIIFFKFLFPNKITKRTSSLLLICQMHNISVLAIGQGIVK